MQNPLAYKRQPAAHDDWTLARHPARLTVLAVVLGIIALLVFRAFPAIDLWGSGLFYHDAAFPMQASPVWNMVRDAGMLIPRLVMLATAFWFGWVLLRPGLTLPIDIAAPLAGAVSAITGPGLIVNALLKEVWGRPRPYRTEDFGGAGSYVAPGTLSNQCESNCSFVSGEAAAAFWLVWLVFLVPKRWRAACLGVVLAFATGVSLLRMAFGRHYLSDVTISAFISVACITGTIWALQSAVGRRMVAGLTAWANASRRG